MHALLLTVIALGGGEARISDVSNTSYEAAGQQAIAYGDQSGGVENCAHCGGGAGGLAAGGLAARRAGPAPLKGRTMPQTCYAPRYGCYHSNNRFMNRYPAFHGTYYRNPYNYRNYFDYPWHAEMHEPTSWFSHTVPPEQRQQEVLPGQPNASARQFESAYRTAQEQLNQYRR
ncbi:MAG: hypothetical protein ACI9HK_001997 [Pirellulaceae bacterium]|jgi:hypothetical protein